MIIAVLVVVEGVVVVIAVVVLRCELRWTIALYVKSYLTNWVCCI